MAGLWGNSVYGEKALEPGDPEEAISTAQALGDFDFALVDHHGTPKERVQAWTVGFSRGEPSDCNKYLEG